MWSIFVYIVYVPKFIWLSTPNLIIICTYYLISLFTNKYVFPTAFDIRRILLSIFLLVTVIIKTFIYIKQTTAFGDF